MSIRGGREAALAFAENALFHTQPSGTPQNLLSLSIGPEHADDLIDDPRQALPEATPLRRQRADRLADGVRGEKWSPSIRRRGLCLADDRAF